MRRANPHRWRAALMLHDGICADCRTRQCSVAHDRLDSDDIGVWLRYADSVLAQGVSLVDVREAFGIRADQ